MTSKRLDSISIEEISSSNLIIALAVIFFKTFSSSLRSSFDICSFLNLLASSTNVGVQIVKTISNSNLSCR